MGFVLRGDKPTLRMQGTSLSLSSCRYNCREKYCSAYLGLFPVGGLSAVQAITPASMRSSVQVDVDRETAKFILSSDHFLSSWQRELVCRGNSVRDMEAYIEKLSVETRMVAQYCVNSIEGQRCQP